MTKTEIIQETADFYSADTSRRSVKKYGNVCYYLHPKTGNNCAVGRCLIDPKIIAESGLNNHAVCDLDLEDMLKPQYLGHSKKFWSDLQLFHDSSRNWDKNGLTELGQADLSGLLGKYKDQ